MNTTPLWKLNQFTVEEFVRESQIQDKNLKWIMELCSTTLNAIKLEENIYMIKDTNLQAHRPTFDLQELNYVFYYFLRELRIKRFESKAKRNIQDITNHTSIFYKEYFEKDLGKEYTQKEYAEIPKYKKDVFPSKQSFKQLINEIYLKPDFIIELLDSIINGNKPSLDNLIVDKVLNEPSVRCIDCDSKKQIRARYCLRCFNTNDHINHNTKLYIKKKTFLCSNHSKILDQNPNTSTEDNWINKLELIKFFFYLMIISQENLLIENPTKDQIQLWEILKGGLNTIFHHKIFLEKASLTSIPFYLYRIQHIYNTYFVYNTKIDPKNIPHGPGFFKTRIFHNQVLCLKLFRRIYKNQPNRRRDLLIEKLSLYYKEELEDFKSYSKVEVLVLFTLMNFYRTLIVITVQESDATSENLFQELRSKFIHYFTKILDIKNEEDIQKHLTFWLMDILNFFSLFFEWLGMNKILKKSSANYKNLNYYFKNKLFDFDVLLLQICLATLNIENITQYLYNMTYRYELEIPEIWDSKELIKRLSKKNECFTDYFHAYTIPHLVCHLATSDLSIYNLFAFVKNDSDLVIKKQREWFDLFGVSTINHQEINITQFLSYRVIEKYDFKLPTGSKRMMFLNFLYPNKDFQGPIEQRHTNTEVFNCLAPKLIDQNMIEICIDMIYKWTDGEEKWISGFLNILILALSIEKKTEKSYFLNNLLFEDESVSRLMQNIQSTQELRPFIMSIIQFNPKSQLKADSIKNLDIQESNHYHVMLTELKSMTLRATWESSVERKSSEVEKAGIKTGCIICRQAIEKGNSHYIPFQVGFAKYEEKPYDIDKQSHLILDDMQREILDHLNIDLESKKHIDEFVLISSCNHTFHNTCYQNTYVEGDYPRVCPCKRPFDFAYSKKENLSVFTIISKMRNETNSSELEITIKLMFGLIGELWGNSRLYHKRYSSFIRNSFKSLHFLIDEFKTYVAGQQNYLKGQVYIPSFFERIDKGFKGMGEVVSSTEESEPGKLKLGSKAGAEKSKLKSRVSLMVNETKKPSILKIADMFKAKFDGKGLKRDSIFHRSSISGPSGRFSKHSVCDTGYNDHLDNYRLIEAKGDHPIDYLDVDVYYEFLLSYWKILVSGKKPPSSLYVKVIYMLLCQFLIKIVCNDTKAFRKFESLTYSRLCSFGTESENIRKTLNEMLIFELRRLVLFYSLTLLKEQANLISQKIIEYEGTEKYMNYLLSIFDYKLDFDVLTSQGIYEKLQVDKKYAENLQRGISHTIDFYTSTDPENFKYIIEKTFVDIPTNVLEFYAAASKNNATLSTDVFCLICGDYFGNELLEKHATKHNSVGVYVHLDDLKFTLTLREYKKTCNQRLFSELNPIIKNRKRLEKETELNVEFLEKIEDSILQNKLTEVIFDS